MFHSGNFYPDRKLNNNQAKKLNNYITMRYVSGTRLEIRNTKQIKCNFLNFLIMRSIYVTILSLILSLNLFAAISYDTTYSREWNKQTETWQNFDRIISTFSDNLITQETIQIFENGKWINYNTTLFNYNNNVLVEELDKYWNESSNVWENNYRKLFSYNSTGLLSQVLHQYIFNGIYMNSSREVYNYTPDGQLNEKVVQKFDEAWTNFLKYQYYFLTNDLMLEENMAYWNENDWDETSFSITYSYDDLNNIVKKVKTKSFNKKKQNLIEEKFIYGENSRLVEHTIAQWNKRNNKWEDKNRAVFENDLNGFVISALNQNKDSKSWDNYLFTEFTGNNDNITSRDITDGMTFSIYPINYGKQAKIEFDNPYNETYFVKVYSENGQMLSSATTENSEVSIDARQLHEGLYFIELQGRHLFSGQFSIE